MNTFSDLDYLMPPSQEWQTLFEIRRHDGPSIDDDDFSGNWSWDVVNIHSGQVVGNYRDANYARKQAKRKYKKLMKLIDRSFTDINEAS